MPPYWPADQNAELKKQNTFLSLLKLSFGQEKLQKMIQSIF